MAAEKRHRSSRKSNLLKSGSNQKPDERKGFGRKSGNKNREGSVRNVTGIFSGDVDFGTPDETSRNAGATN